MIVKNFGILGVSALFGAFFSSSTVLAQHIYVDPRIEERFTVTDNVNLAETDRVLDEVLNSAIGINARIEGNKLRASVDYSLDHFLFLSDGTDDYRQSMFGTLDAEVIEDHFNVIGRASLRQQFLDQRGSLSGSAANRTDNRRLVQSYTGTGIFKGGVRDFADWRMTYRYGLQRSPADDLTDDSLPINFSDSSSHELSARLGSGSRFNNFDWELTASSKRVTRSLEVNDFRSESAGANFTFKFNRHFHVIGGMTYTSNDFQNAVLGEDGLGWEAGFRWIPGKKLDLTVTTGKEGARSVWYASLQHFFSARLNFQGSYTDTITTNSLVLNDNLNSLQFSGDLGIVNNEQLPIDETDPNFSFSDVDFRRQSLVGTFTLQQKRTKHYISGSYERRTFDDNSGTARSWGTSYGVDRKVTEKTILSARLSYRQSLFEDGVRIDDFIVGNVSWAKTISEYFRISISYDHSQRQSNANGEDLMENALTFYLRGTF
jgi:uncharacterized protein (PEP-CTERM system associated)